MHLYIVQSLDQYIISAQQTSQQLMYFRMARIREFMSPTSMNQHILEIYQSHESGHITHASLRNAVSHSYFLSSFTYCVVNENKIK